MPKTKKVSLTFKRLGCGSSRNYVLKSIVGFPTVNTGTRKNELRVNDQVHEAELAEICKADKFNVRISA